jgi:hypothetical protein
MPIIAYTRSSAMTLLTYGGEVNEWPEQPSYFGNKDRDLSYWELRTVRYCAELPPRTSELYRV